METGPAQQELHLPVVPRFQHAQVNRSLIHPTLPQPPPLELQTTTSNTAIEPSAASLLTQATTESHCFVVAADTQFGMMAANRNWDIEMEFSRKAVDKINALRPRPLFCCICGDLVDMTSNIYQGKPKQYHDDSTVTVATTTTTTVTSSSSPLSLVWTKEECDHIQEQQNNDMKRIWSNLHPEIALICLCGNHDVGNRPTPTSIAKYQSSFGDDYLAFWANGTYNIVLNSALFSDPTDAKPLYTTQLQWLERQLIYATKYAAGNIFVFSHHPWFLYSEDEDSEDLTGRSYFEPGKTDQYISDSYFPIPKQYRRQVMDLFRRHNVSASFSGHFHQNVVSQSSFGMEMIITGGLSMVLDSTGNPNVRNEVQTQGFRIVTVEHDLSGGSNRGTFHHHFVSISS
jgi:serine/threonine-protein phosphatase CPPED1